MGGGNKNTQMKTSYLPQVTDKFYDKKFKIVYKMHLPVGTGFWGVLTNPYTLKTKNP